MKNNIIYLITFSNLSEICTELCIRFLNTKKLFCPSPYNPWNIITAKIANVIWFLGPKTVVSIQINEFSLIGWRNHGIKWTLLELFLNCSNPETVFLQKVSIRVNKNLRSNLKSISAERNTTHVHWIKNSVSRYRYSWYRCIEISWNANKNL